LLQLRQSTRAITVACQLISATALSTAKSFVQTLYGCSSQLEKSRSTNRNRANDDDIAHNSISLYPTQWYQITTVTDRSTFSSSSSSRQRAAGAPGTSLYIDLSWYSMRTAYDVTALTSSEAALSRFVL